MAIQEKARGEAQQRAREGRTGQPSLLSSDELHDTSHSNSLRDRYLAKSKDLVLQRLKTNDRVPYDDVWSLAMSQPMTWESDLKGWIKVWGSRIRVEGMKPGQKVPQRGNANSIVWLPTP